MPPTCDCGSYRRVFRAPDDDLAQLFVGPITVFNYTVYDIIAPRGTNYFAFMAWIGM